MKEIITNNKIEYYDDEGNEIMYIDCVPSYYLWCFNSSDIITVTSDMKLYKALEELMNQQYKFNDGSLLKNYKDDNYLKWFSDCYYNPDDEFSYKSVSYLNIKREKGTFKVWCIKPLDEIMNRPLKFHAIAFAPSFNGEYSRNLLTGLTLQDDFALKIYQRLINDKSKKLSKNR